MELSSRNVMPIGRTMHGEREHQTTNSIGRYWKHVLPFGASFVEAALRVHDGDDFFSGDLLLERSE